MVALATKQDESQLMVWVDVETTGLNARQELPLELGIVVTNTDGIIIAQKSSLVFDHRWQTRLELAEPIVREMHEKSGLLADLKQGSHDVSVFKTHRVEKIDNEFYDWLTVTLGMTAKIHPMCGSTINFDRSFLEQHFPLLYEFFHHRNIDVSSVKNLCEKLNPEVFAKKVTMKGNHRVLNDIAASVSEYLFYKNNFLWTTK